MGLPQLATKLQKGKSYIGGVSWIAAPIMPIFTNATQVIRVVRFAHRISSDAAEILDVSDLIVFGQGNEARFNLYE